MQVYWLLWYFTVIAPYGRHSFLFWCWSCLCALCCLFHSWIKLIMSVIYVALTCMLTNNLLHHKCCPFAAVKASLVLPLRNWLDGLLVYLEAELLISVDFGKLTANWCISKIISCKFVERYWVFCLQEMTCLSFMYVLILFAQVYTILTRTTES